ncbi:HpcH/HpaI aldolase family protein [Streptomyces acidicola]|uniref:HpcH/HpaI aldolase family protein n=1 Tax=Streptomyces acidicola TaxID=2596892 RepID=UPI00343FC3FD
MAPQPLRALAARRPVFGTFLKLPRPEVVDILSLSGLDFLICDMEHAQIDEEGARTVIQAGRATGIPIVVRVPSLEPGQVNRLLEAGAEGIQLSGTTSVAQAADLSAFSRYPPVGRRGLSTAQPAAGYGTVPLPQYLADSNERVLRVGQLESAHYDDPLEKIVAELDIAFIGVMDLSVDLGLPGQLQAPAVQEKIAEIAAAANRTTTPLGIFAADEGTARHAAVTGYRYIAVASDLALLSAAARERLRPLTNRPGATAERGDNHG